MGSCLDSTNTLSVPSTGNGASFGRSHGSGDLDMTSRNASGFSLRQSSHCDSRLAHVKHWDGSKDEDYSSGLAIVRVGERLASLKGPLRRRIGN